MVQPVAYVYVTCEFGRPGQWAAGYHTGIDYRAPIGTKIYATKGGTVIHSGWGGFGSAYGNHIVLRSLHNGRTIYHLYAHLSDTNVIKGQPVKANQWIGLSGATGNVSGPHLHYEERVSPFGYFNHIRPVLPAYRPLSFVPATVSLAKLKPGKKNYQIRRLQRRLNKAVGAGLPITGYYGPATKAAAKKWQERLGFSGKDADGVVGKSSLEKLGFKVIP